MGSAYNPERKHAANQSESDTSESGRCKAHNCPLPGSMSIEGNTNLCPYHARAPRGAWNEITEMLRKNKRRFLLVNAASRLRADEFDKLQQSQEWDLDELVRPLPNENQVQWLGRIKDTVHKALKFEANKIILRNVEGGTVSVGGREFSLAVHQLTSGILRKPKSTKDKNQQLDELEQRRAA